MPVQPKDWEASSVRLAEQAAAPGTPAAGYGRLFLDDAPELQWIDDAGGVHRLVDVASLPADIGVACSDETTAIASTGTKVTFRMPHAMTVTEVRASLTGACTTGTFTVDINDGGTTILSTKLTVDAGEKTSETAATPTVISDSALADDAEITVDVDNVGDGTATGLKIWIIGTRA